MQNNSYLTSLQNVNSKVSEFKKEFHQVEQYSKDVIPQFQNYILKTEKKLVKRIMCEIESLFISSAVYIYTFSCFRYTIN